MTIDGLRIELGVGHTGLIIATSPDLCGLFVSGRSFDQVEAELRQAISDLRTAWPHRPVDRAAEAVSRRVTKLN